MKKKLTNEELNMKFLEACLVLQQMKRQGLINDWKVKITYGKP